MNGVLLPVGGTLMNGERGHEYKRVIGFRSWIQTRLNQKRSHSIKNNFLLIFDGQRNGREGLDLICPILTIWGFIEDNLKDRG